MQKHMILIGLVVLTQAACLQENTKQVSNEPPFVMSSLRDLTSRVSENQSVGISVEDPVHSKAFELAMELKTAIRVLDSDGETIDSTISLEPDTPGEGSSGEMVLTVAPQAPLPSGWVQINLGIPASQVRYSVEDLGVTESDAIQIRISKDSLPVFSSSTICKHADDSGEIEFRFSERVRLAPMAELSDALEIRDGSGQRVDCAEPEEGQVGTPDGPLRIEAGDLIRTWRVQCPVLPAELNFTISNVVSESGVTAKLYSGEQITSGLIVFEELEESGDCKVLRM